MAPGYFFLSCRAVLCCAAVLETSGCWVALQARLMADDFKMSEDGGSKVYGKQGELQCGVRRVIYRSWLHKDRQEQCVDGCRSCILRVKLVAFGACIGLITQPALLSTEPVSQSIPGRFVTSWRCDSLTKLVVRCTRHIAMPEALLSAILTHNSTLVVYKG